ncbi:MAG TPA: hypothetical protein VFC63_14510 [Blastocatellia bacterium]|nr:hypothetical protein [Blastocatellia bacterium]
MNITGRTGVALLILFVFCLTIGARHPAPVKGTPKTDLTAEEIIARSITALGGQDALDKIKTRIIRATYHNVTDPCGEGAFEFYQKADKYLNVTHQACLSDLIGEKEGFDGKIFWRGSLLGEVLKGSNLEALKTRSRISGYGLKIGITPETNWKLFYDSAEVLLGFEVSGQPKESAANADSYVLKFSPLEGSATIKVYDKSSFLLTRIYVTQTVIAGAGPVLTRTELSDYRFIDGVRIPFVICLTDSVGFFYRITKLTEVKNNIPIDDSVFNKPDLPFSRGEINKGLSNSLSK